LYQNASDLTNISGITESDGVPEHPSQRGLELKGSVSLHSVGLKRKIIPQLYLSGFFEIIERACHSSFASLATKAE
jgi:hypothetical protein